MNFLAFRHDVKYDQDSLDLHLEHLRADCLATPQHWDAGIDLPHLIDACRVTDSKVTITDDDYKVICTF